MKKIVYLLLIFTTFSYSQNAFMEFQFDAKRGTESAILALTDEVWGKAEFKSGGINIESFNIGNAKSSHRIVLYGDPANWGRSDSLVNEDKWSVFIQKMNNHIEKWTHSSSGNIISWVGDSEDYSYVQIYEFKASDPSAFKSAHDKIVSQMSSIMGEREIGFGSYEIGGYNAASHWVAISAKNWTDLILTRRKMKELTKEWDEYYKKRGNVEHVRNYTTNIVKRY
jgi:hypothetical protein|tara:strand:+ start:320 stop:994 length:675 start_codon:yes stop_codon:yes gene_type:complete